MQYWRKLIGGQLERLPDDLDKKHPEKIKSLKDQGFIRVKSESDFSVYEEPKKQAKKKPAKKKPAVKKKKAKTMKK